MWVPPRVIGTHPLVLSLVVATAAVGTHPTGMHSCEVCPDWIFNATNIEFRNFPNHVDMLEVGVVITLITAIIFSAKKRIECI